MSTTTIEVPDNVAAKWREEAEAETVEERREPAEGEEAEPEAAARPTVSPARALPGDPEIRVPAPADARDVTIVLPFGESLTAEYERGLGVWTARFLIPRDADEGTYPIEILVTHANGRLEHLRLWYTVDATAASVQVEVEGEVVPGAELTLRAEQVITAADLAQVGREPGELTDERALLLSDARRVEARTPDGDVVLFEPAGPAAWQATWTVPADADGAIRLDVVVVDMAANVAHQPLVLQVAR